VSYQRPALAADGRLGFATGQKGKCFLDEAAQNAEVHICKSRILTSSVRKTWDYVFYQINDELEKHSQSRRTSCQFFKQQKYVYRLITLS
jgi:hypothetical protein